MMNPICVLLGIGLIALTGCGLNSTPDQVAGVGTQTGILVQGNPEETKAQIKNSGLAHKVLNEKHGLYEVYGLDSNQAQELFPDADTSPNQYIANLIPEKQSKAEVFKKLIRQNGNLSMIAQAGAQQQLPPILETCKMETPRESAPVAKISTKSPMTNQVAASQYNNAIGTSLLMRPAGFSSETSTYLDGTSIDSPTTRWMIVPPQHSKVNPEIQNGVELNFSPDNVGSYDVIQVVEDANNACGVSLFTLLVTANPQLILPTASDTKPSVPLDDFKHLDLMNAKEAWEISTGEGVTVAILDTGVNYNSRGIQWNLAVDESELAGSPRADVDGNGFDNDYIGWDFVNNDNTPFDDEGHGSHCAGLTASHLFGIAKGAKILPVKVMNAAGGGTAGDISAGILYAVDKGAKIISMSLGGHGPALYPIKKAIEYAQSRGILVVVASGNGHPQTGVGINLADAELDFIQPFEICSAGGSGSPFIDSLCEMGFRQENLVDIFPAEFQMDNILTVAATDENDSLTSYSNYGLPMVDVAAPGGSVQQPIWSLATQNAENYSLAPSIGTSMAAPMVAGVAAVMVAAAPDLSATEIISVLKATGKPSSAVEGKVVSGTVMNVVDALEAVGATPAPLPFASRQNIDKSEVLSAISEDTPLTSGIAATAL